MTRRETILAEISDKVFDFLHSEHNFELEKAISWGEISISEMAKHFENELRKHIE